MDLLLRHFDIFEKEMFVTQTYDIVYILEDCLSNLLLFPEGFIA